MQMIDVLKRLAELDANNPQVIKESTEVAECGPMGMMGMPEPKTPATLNITAGDGEELGSMLAAIMQLAGVQKVEPEHLGVEHEPMSLTAEPSLGGDQSAGDEMRSVIDKMHDMGDEEGDEEETDEGEYDNSPADPTDAPSFEPNEFAQNTNDGDGDDAHGRKRTAFQPTATFEGLMKEYRQFIGEEEEEEEVDEAKDEEADEGIEDRLKDLDPKNPVNIPAYQRKAKSGDSAAAARGFKEDIDSTDLLKLAGLK